jgi:hypothetical protein
MGNAILLSAVADAYIQEMAGHQSMLEITFVVGRVDRPNRRKEGA